MDKALSTRQVACCSSSLHQKKPPERPAARLTCVDRSILGKPYTPRIFFPLIDRIEFYLKRSLGVFLIVRAKKVAALLCLFLNGRDWHMTAFAAPQNLGRYWAQRTKLRPDAE